MPVPPPGRPHRAVAPGPRGRQSAAVATGRGPPRRSLAVAALFVGVAAASGGLAPPADGAWFAEAAPAGSLYGRFATAEKDRIDAVLVEVNGGLELAEQGARYELGLALRWAAVSYTVGETKQRGVYYAAGAYAAWTSPSDGGYSVGFSGAYLPLAAMTVVSDTEAQINGNSVETSTLTVFRGGSGIEVGARATRDVSPPFMPNTPVSVGLYSALVFQTFATRSAKGVSSDPQRAPGGAGGAVKDTLLVLVLGACATWHL